ncbi:bifunctional glutamate N-acetyltransferase/amino-acid acetyltransferase ArgJ [Pelosinus sp. sgz500959]|uniref:bifunctional glutamate N-acetyltransferase/amino-acid acetyltransferase ArgJ n=1 Tax=Pelosinus sp. sgz500959 TaxID=3242472 RepID=UPI00366D7B86
MLKKITGGITAPKGYKAAGVKAGLKKSGKLDVALIYSEKPASVAAVFTTNTMAAAPVLVSRQAVEQGTVSAVVINSGCANACTGPQGLVDAKDMAHITAQLLQIEDHEVIVGSTGIIGVNLQMDKINTGIKEAVSQLDEKGYDNATAAIMTTDTFPKSCSYEFELGGVPVKIAGIAKGSGMIHPNMATMLCVITTDAAIASPILQKSLTEAINLSFNMISVDGDSSTNDMASVLANGLAANPLIDSIDSADYKAFTAALTEVCIYLAQQIVRDGEGATKFLEVTVQGAESFSDAKKAVMAIAKSPLVKTAFFGEDANWGRILCAVGYSEAAVNPEKISLAIGDVTIVKEGMGVEVDEKALKAIMAEQDITVTVDLNLGESKATMWTCDFSYEYVKINGEYHT